METTVNHKGIDIKIERDTFHNLCPFEDWDCMMPLMYLSDGIQKDYSDSIYDYIDSQITDGQIIYHQKKIIEILNLNEDYFEDLDRDSKVAEFRDEFVVTKLTLLDDLLTFFKIKHYFTISRGYSKSDYAEILVVPTLQFQKESGRDIKDLTEEDLQVTSKLWSDWAWGDVYSFIIEVEEDDFVDSCTGFYGDNHEESGLLENAKQSIDSYLESKKKDKESKLKTLIKNKVPLTKRDLILN